MSTVDDLLARSLLHRHDVPPDVVPYDDHVADRFLPWEGHRPGAAEDSAARSLSVLCETVVTHCTAEELADFLTEQVPEPRTARILGCALQLAGSGGGARLWWQYAAGADDVPASYCLYLQHLTQGETHAAALWRAQAGAYVAPDDTTDPEQDRPAQRRLTADTSVATVLRVLTRLGSTTPRPLAPAVRAAIQFVARAVSTGYRDHPDLEIPLPGSRFAERLGNVVAAAADCSAHPRPSAGAEHAGAEHAGAEHTEEEHTEEEHADELPDRLTTNPALKAPPARWATPDPEDLLVKVTSPSREPASARRLFEGAAAVCWQAATITDDADVRGSHLAYYRLRRHSWTDSPAPSGFTHTRTPTTPPAPPPSAGGRIRARAGRAG